MAICYSYRVKKIVSFIRTFIHSYTYSSLMEPEGRTLLFQNLKTEVRNSVKNNKLYGKVSADASGIPRKLEVTCSAFVVVYHRHIS
jgi:hypothetical protein